MIYLPATLLGVGAFVLYLVALPPLGELSLPFAARLLFNLLGVIMGAGLGIIIFLLSLCVTRVVTNKWD
jgi:hypothetical protein